LFVALVGHSAYRVRKANREHAARTSGVELAADATYTEW